MGVGEMVVQQHEEVGAPPQQAPEKGAVANPSLTALCTIARFHQIAADASLLSHQLGLTPSEPIDAATLLRAAKHLGLKAKFSRTTPDRLSLTPLPALAVLRGEDGAERFVILAQCDAQRVLLQDPSVTSAEAARPVIEPLDVFAAHWTGELILIFGQVDIVAVAPGKIIVSERTKIIQPLEVSVVKRVLVRDGDHVEAGQALVELDPTTANADKTSIDEQLKSMQSEVLRTRALLLALNVPTTVRSPELSKDIPSGWTAVDADAAKAQLSDEWSDITAKLAKATAEIARRQAEIATVREMVAKLETTVPIAKQREADFQQLAKQGFMSSHANQDRTRERIELERDLATQRARLAEANATLRESENIRAAYIAETKHSLRTREAAAELKRQQGTQDLAKAGQRERLTTLKAPVAGTVQQLAAHTEGGVVTEAQPLMVIVPDGAQVTAEVTLENKDIGFVSPTQEATIKLETFSYTRYGTVNATVKTVTADAVNDEKRGAIFPVTLSLGATTIDVDGRAIKLSPGMNLTAEIKTGKRRVIEFLLSPVQRATSESLRER